MSNIYIQEPPTNGKVLLKTSVGDIDLELWSKETPKACRNFVQLCLEGYYNGTIFHRVVKGFIVQGGDPTGTGTGGESIYGHPFKDEFHSRLRFNRRGLLAMANSDKDDNGSQFFFTLGATPELQNKHTIFGKVTGETIFNMLKLEDALTDQDERPLYPQKVIRTEVLSNPFPDIIPRSLPKAAEEKQEKSKKDKRSGVKNFKLLSFGEEAEEDEEETLAANKKFSGRSKSTHDVLNDPKLSSIPAVETIKDAEKSESDLSEDEDLQDAKPYDREEMENIRKKLSREKPEAKVKTKESITAEKDEEEEKQLTLSDDDDKHAKKRKEMEDIQKQIKEVKREMQSIKKRKQEEEIEAEKERKTEEVKNETLQEYKQEQEKYKALKSQLPKRGSSREDFTLQLLAKFQKKLASAKEKVQDSDTLEAPSESSDADREDPNDDEWLAHKLHFESNTPVLAKDASTKNDDWFEIYDPRNPINKRRREASKDQLKNKARR